MSKNSIEINGNSIPSVPRDPDFFINKTMVFYGTTNSGKSFLIDDIMYICSKKIPEFWVFCGSNTKMEDYKDKIPDVCLNTVIEKDFLKKFKERQDMKSKLFNYINKTSTLEEVLSYCPNQTTFVRQKSMLFNKLDEAGRKYPHKMKTKDIEKKKVQFMKKIIHMNRPYLEKLFKQRDQEELLRVVKYLDLNPRAMLVMDDCASHIPALLREDKSNSLTELFFNGRHYNITTAITTQDIKYVAPQIRKNAMLSFCTTKKTANDCFTNESNSFTRDVRRKAQNLIDHLFDMGNYEKLVYSELYDKFYYFRAEEHPDLKVGADYLWKLSSLKGSERVDNNFNSMFKV